ncbi:recombinase family protein, partial [Mycobacterium sp.]|uniref:recombinase family protein n=1 Tax=Mycobacterium sp. TaxID=1785 RepID=UPI003C78A392
MRAGIYVRISQDRTGAGLGVERQADDCQQLCEAKSWKVVEVYVDNDVSAFSGKRRPEWERLLADIAAGEIDAVVGWHVDRLTRSPRELEDVIDLAERHGLELATVTGDIDLGTVSGRTFARMLGVMARNESEHKSERQRRANEQSAAAGKVHGGGMRPFGYAKDRRTVVTEEAEIVKECAERVLAGDSLRGVARELRARGAQTSAGRDWQPRSLRQVLL